MRKLSLGFDLIYSNAVITKNDNTTFPADLIKNLDKGSKVYQISEETFVNVIDAHALRKTKVYVVIKNLVLTKISGKQLRNDQH